MTLIADKVKCFNKRSIALPFSKQGSHHEKGENNPPFTLNICVKCALCPSNCKSKVNLAKPSVWYQKETIKGSSDLATYEAKLLCDRA